VPRVTAPCPKTEARAGRVARVAPGLTVRTGEIRALYGRRSCTPERAALVRRFAPHDRGVLPRWHTGEQRDGVHYRAAVGAYVGLLAWSGREHYLAFVVPVAVACGREELRAARVSAGTFVLWARVETLYCQDQRTGRRCVVRPDTVAAVSGLHERTVQRCRAVAALLGLRVAVFAGRMLTVTECVQARRRGCRQRGLSAEAAFTIPSPLRAAVVAATPTRGTPPQAPHSPTSSSTVAGYAEKAKAASPPQPRQRRRRDRRALILALWLAQAVPWLRTERPGRLAPALARFATADPAWTARDVVQVVDAANARLGYTSLTGTQIKTRPAAVLAWYLRDVDPIADHPRAVAFTAGVANEQRLPWCGRCEQVSRLVQLEHAVARCPRCHPLSPERPW
jgi:hypothetical protein